MVKLNAAQLRKGPPSLKLRRIKKNDIYIVLDNVLDTYNIGSIFRLADAVAAKKVYLCGGTETPPNPRIKKASINTTEWVEWEYCETAVEAVTKVRNLWGCHPEVPPCHPERLAKDLPLASLSQRSGRMRDSNELRDSSASPQNDKREAQNDKKGIIVAIEQTPKSIPYHAFEYKLPICLVVGHETHGVSKEVLDLCDDIVEIPMFGVNISLNVMVSLAIVLYEVVKLI